MIGKKARAADSSNLGVLRATRYTSKVTQLLSSKNQAKPATILALDYGRARIGLAIADAQARLAKPLATLERINRNEDMRRLRELVREHSVRQIVVGLPLRLDGTRGEMAEEAENPRRKRRGQPDRGQFLEAELRAARHRERVDLFFGNEEHDFMATRAQNFRDSEPRK